MAIFHLRGKASIHKDLRSLKNVSNTSVIIIIIIIIITITIIIIIIITT